MRHVILSWLLISRLVLSFYQRLMLSSGLKSLAKGDFACTQSKNVIKCIITDNYLDSLSRSFCHFDRLSIQPLFFFRVDYPLQAHQLSS